MEGRLAELLRTGRHDPSGDLSAVARSPKTERLLIKSSGRVSFVEIDSIDWIQAEGNYVRIHAGGQVHLMRETMNGLLEKIGSHRFFRIHRSRIVNVSRVKELLIAGGGDYQVVLIDGTKLGLSRLYRDALQDHLTRR